MNRFRHFLFVLMTALLVAGGEQLWAQTTVGVQAVEPPVKPQPALSRPLLFPYGSGAAKNDSSVVYLDADQVSQADRELAAASEGEIRARAGFHGIDAAQGQWSWRQVACPALPHHLFLLFLRSEGVGGQSLFSVSIPQDGRGRVRVIPIKRRGYGLFSPAPINAQTVAAFNQIRAEEHSGPGGDWLGTGLCYAALAGLQPATTEQGFAPPAVLEAFADGGAAIRFTDAAAARPMEYTLRFDRTGKLLKAVRTPAALVREKAERSVAVDLSGKVEHPAVVDLTGKKIQ
jgi:hypothetical protein